jgi:hypothetical protein
MHQWILGTKEEANSVLEDFIVRKIQYHQGQMEIFQELLQSLKDDNKKSF